VKEADALCNAGYAVTVLYSSFVPWADKADVDLLASRKWQYKLVGGCSSVNKAIFLFTRIRYKIAGILCRHGAFYFSMAERSQARAYDELLREAKKIKADWYIGHNLGALAVAVNAANFNNAKAGFDFEDYHRGEVGEAETAELKRMVHLENKYVPSLKYFSAASEMISIVTKENHPAFTGKVITLNNCFPLSQQPPFREKKGDENSLQLFWFSQTIGLKRGLEVLLDALQILNDPSIHLTLAGRLDGDFSEYIDVNAKNLLRNIHFAGIIPPEDLPAFSAQFDAGLAIELSTPANRNVCLTNKVFTYLLAGNAILFSETDMQKKFNAVYRAGEAFSNNDANGLAQKIIIYKKAQILDNQRRYNYKLAKEELNWEREMEKFLAVI
jgi:glycosyltransferase involved in cell wall biosynthesis